MWREHLGFCKPNFLLLEYRLDFGIKDMLWYIMNACVIMYNMIIEDERGQDFDYTHYELMGVPVQPRRRAERVARFVASYHAIRHNDAHDKLQKDLIEEWWTWNGQH